MFWTWDHSTEWEINRAGAQTIGASNYYARKADLFEQDYGKLVDWCGRHAVDSVVIWGLLRDSHGGLESAKRLCDVATQKGVRILCGVGLNAYGGVYYEGNSPWSLEQHLLSHPELYGLDADGKRMAYSFGNYGPRVSHHACPSRRENQEFAVESLQWLFKNLPQLGGVQIETGDTGVCQCHLCKQRRRHAVSSFSWEDMALMYPIAIKAIRSAAPDAWTVCETYSHPEPYTGPKPAPGFGEGKPPWAEECLAQVSEDVFVQWVCDDFVKPISTRKWTEAGKVSKERHRHVMRSHHAVYWRGLRGELAIDWIADMVQQSMAHGFEGISLFGEVSPFHTGAELNYLALENYGSAANPKADLSVFLRDVAAPVLGGEKEAHDYLRYARLLKKDRDRIASALKDIYVRCGKLPPGAARRWTWLANHLATLIYSEQL
jgi:hypothetical protein